VDVAIETMDPMRWGSADLMIDSDVVDEIIVSFEEPETCGSESL
jgi:hypothetical protein